MTSAYPAGLDSFTNPTPSDNLSTSVGGRTHSGMHTDLNDAMEAVQAELGTDPSGSFATVKARLDGILGYLPWVPKVGGYLGPPNVSSWVSNSNQARTSGNAGPAPIMVTKQITIDRLACYVDTAQAATTIRMGLYSSDSDGFPTTRVAEVSVSGAATGQIDGTISATVLTPGLYWAIAYVSSTTTLRLRGIYYTSAGMVGPSAMTIGGNQFMVANFGSSAALTTPISSWTLDLPDNVPLVAVRRSA